MVNKLRQSDIDWEGLTGEKLSTTKKKVHKRKKKAAMEAMDEKEKKKALREGIGLSAEREKKEGAKVMAFNPMPETEKQGEEKEAGEMEEKAAVFSHQEAEELEELLREFFV